MIKAVLFDFDGVTANTIPYHVQAWQEVLLPHSIHVNDYIVRINEGGPAWKIAKAIFKDNGQQIDDEKAREFAHQKNVIFRAKNSAQAYSEILPLFKFFRTKNIKIGLVTGTTMKNIETVLTQNYIDFFDAKITDGIAKHGKPAPDPYLLAAEKLDVSPQDCMVIENAPLGVESAKNAGMFCIALETTLSRELLNKADVIFQNHAKFLANLPQLKINGVVL